MAKAAIYCRLSVEDKNKNRQSDESESIQNQKSLLVKYCIEKGWDIYNFYCDEDYSGADNERPAFNDLLKSAENNEFDIVVCKTQSRFSRDMEIVEKYIHNKFLEWNVRFVSVVDNADTSDKGNKKSRQINGLVNEWFLEDLSDNIRMVLNNKRNEGKYIGSYEPFGYEKDKLDKNKLVIDEAAAEVVRRIFDMYISGMGSTIIAQTLNRESVPNPSNYKKLKGVPYSPPKQSTTRDKWSDTTIRAILTNEMYIGNMVQGKLKRVSYKNQKLVRVPKEQWVIVEGTHEPIVDKELFQRVQQRFGKYAKPCKDGKINPLAYKMKCMYCGGSFHKHKSKQIDYIRCRTNISQHELCVEQSMRLDTLTQIVLDKINELIERYKDDDYIEDNIVIIDERERERGKLETQLQDAQIKLDEKTLVIKNLYLDKLKGVLTEEQFVEFNSGFLAEKDLLEKQLGEITAKLENLDKATDELQSKRELIKKHSKIEVLTKEIVDKFVDFVEIGKDEDGKIVKIHWLV